MENRSSYRPVGGGGGGVGGEGRERLRLLQETYIGRLRRGIDAVIELVESVLRPNKTPSLLADTTNFFRRFRNSGEMDDRACRSGLPERPDMPTVIDTKSRECTGRVADGVASHRRVT